MRRFRVINGIPAPAVTAALALTLAGSLISARAYASPRLVEAGTSQNTYLVAGGKLSGALVSVASAAAYQSAGTHFLFDPSRLSSSFTRPQFFAVSGEQVNGQWTYPYQVSPDRDKGILTMSVAIDATKHTQLIAAGAPTPTQLKSFHVTNTSVAPAACPSLVTNSVQPLCAGGVININEDTYWYDPVGIEVTDVITGLRCSWSLSTYRVAGCSAGDTLNWYQPSAWSLTSHSFSWYYASDHSWAEADSYAHFHNSNFPACLGNSTDIYYSPNWERINGDGNWSSNVNTWVASNAIQCVYLLHYSRYTYGG